jgi:hypothetical protein
MTTWDEPCYTTDIPSKIASFITRDDVFCQLWNKYFCPTIATLEGLQITDLSQLKTSSGIAKVFPNAFSRKDEFIARSIFALCSKSDVIHIGLPAVYRFVQIHEKLETNHEMPYVKMFQTTKEIDQFDMLNSLSTPKRIKKMTDKSQMLPKILSRYQHCIDMSYTMLHLGYYWRTKSQNSDVDKLKRTNEIWPEVSDDNITMGKSIRKWSFPGLTILQYDNTRDSRKELYILDNKSMRRCVQFLRSFAKLHRYYYIASAQNDDMSQLSAWLALSNVLLESLMRGNRPNECARAWDVLYYMELAKEATDIWDVSLRLQHEKFDSNKYYEIVDDKEVSRIISNLPFIERLEVMKCYKILPCPDFNPFTGFLANKKYHLNQNTYGVMPDEFQHLNVPCSLEGFRAYQRVRYCKRFFKKHLVCPGRLTREGVEAVANKKGHELTGYPHLSAKMVTPQNIHLIDIKGSARWEDVNNNVPDRYNDKAVPPGDIPLSKLLDGYDMSNTPMTEKSYLLWYLNQTEVPTGPHLRYLSYRGSLYKQQTAHFKPESKKPEPRNFYSAGPYRRLISSEWEENVSAYLANDPFAFTVKDPHDQRIALNHILGTKQERERYKVVTVSFDIEKWSPLYPAGAKRDSYNIWLDAFDQPLLDECLKTFEGVDLHFIHEGIHQNYKPGLVDYEGQSGKTNTAFHVDIMSYAVRMLKQMGLYKASGRLAVLIDDGLLSLQFEKNVTNAHIIKCVKVIEATYRFLGFRISWDKTFISEKIAMFLNEVYYNGDNIPTGVKAFLKMQPTKLEDELSVAGKIKGLIAMTQGCVKAGVDPFLAKSELHWEIYMLLVRSGRKNSMIVKWNPIKLALFLYTPIALGGLGLPFTINLVGSPSVDPIATFHSAMQYFTSVQPQFAPQVRCILEQPLRERLDLELLRSPWSTRIAGRCLTEMKHLKYVKEAILSRTRNVLMRPLLTLDMPTAATNILDILGDEVELSEIRTAYQMSPIAVVDKFLAKFKRSATIIGLLAPRVRAKVIASYLVELRVVSLNYESLVVL